MKYKILKIAFFIWIALWLFFLAREVFLKDELSDYRSLLLRSLDGKRSYVTGDRLYEFLTFSSRALPEGARYNLIGPVEGSIEKRRAAYYLYPHIEAPEAQFLLVFDYPATAHLDYDGFASLDGRRYILKKKGE